MSAKLSATNRATVAGLGAAVHRNATFSRAGALERLFTFAFKGLVYPQIWEDPVVDMEALAIRPDDHIVAIASGGCNVMSYLTANPARITAVDLNGAHIALNRLKLRAARDLPDYEAFHRFFGHADRAENVAAYDRWIKPNLDPVSRAYWEGRTTFGRRRVERFARNFYRYGLLGSFIGAGHLLARAHGKDPREMLRAGSLEEQRALFDSVLAPLFETRSVRWLVRQPATLYGLGIPPAQYHALAGDAEGGMIEVLRDRLRRLACDFDFSSNYFARQAFGRGYGADEERGDAALSRKGRLRRRSRARRPRRGETYVDGRLSRFLSAGQSRRLCPARRAGLDERRRSHRSVGEDHPHGAAGRARHFPHRRR